MSSRGSYLTGASGSRYNDGQSIKEALQNKDREMKAKRKSVMQNSKFGRLQKKNSTASINLHSIKRQNVMQEEEIEDGNGIYEHKKDLHRNLNPN